MASAGEPEIPEAPQVSLPEQQEPGTRAPTWRVIGFEDLPDSPDCPPLLASQGACVEEVRFATLPVDSGSEEDAPIQRARARNIAELYAQLWEDLAYRWYRKGDPLEGLGFNTTYDSLGAAADQWERHPLGQRQVAVPDPERWLFADAWYGTTDAFFRPLRAATTAGLTEPPSLMLLSGRFAARLGFNARLHDYDLMDADAASSGPFFEQMYPFAAALAGDNPALKPLRPFQSAETAPRLADASYEQLRRQAGTAFRDFTELLSVQIAQYAVTEYTPNHMRLLAALTAMQAPPGRQAQETGQAGELNAAARGETDAAEAVAARIERNNLALTDGLELRYEQLPVALAYRYVPVLTQEVPMTEEFLAAFNEALAADLYGLIRRDAITLTADGRLIQGLRDLRAEAVSAWIQQNRAPDGDPETLYAHVGRNALRWLMERPELPLPRRYGYETAILLEQVRDAIGASYEANIGRLVAPTEQVSQVTAVWSSVLSRHLYKPTPISQGLGAVDPTAVCTVGKGTAAQKEPVFGAINVDVLVADIEGLTQRPEELLWRQRQALPFLLVDDPLDNPPQITRLVGLPDDRALYRVRWRLWSGWHLLWSAGGASSTLVARTAALCSDLVLAPPDLVPTVVRAGLLDGDARGTIPASRYDYQHPPDEIQPPKDLAWLQALARGPLTTLAGEQALMVVVFDSTAAHDRVLPTDLRPRTPYARTQRRVGHRKRIHTASWALFFQPTAAPVQLSPAYRPEESVSSGEDVPRWRRRATSEWTLTGGAGFFPLRQVAYGCDGSVVDSSGIVAPCNGLTETDRSEGFSADVAMLATIWLIDEPRQAIEVGPALHIDVLHSGTSWFYPDPTQPVYAWSFRPQLGVVVGWRGALDPMPWLGSGRIWGGERPDGSSFLSRQEAGVRAGLLVGPGFNGVEGTGSLEAWTGWSLRNRLGRYSSFTSYDPAILLGPYARGQIGFVFPGLGNDSRYYALEQSWTVIAGVRGQFHFKSNKPEAPSVPSAPKAPTLEGGS